MSGDATGEEVTAPCVGTTADIDLFDVVLPPLEPRGDRRYYTAVKQETYVRVWQEHTEMRATLAAVIQATADKPRLSVLHDIATNALPKEAAPHA